MAVKLGMKKAPDINVEQHYPTYLSMAKNFMEGEGGWVRGREGGREGERGRERGREGGVRGREGEREGG